MFIIENIDKFVQEKGFKDADELIKLICELDLNTEEQNEKFQEWRRIDGTKKGLLGLDS